MNDNDSPVMGRNAVPDFKVSMSWWTELRYWLIRKIAGESTIVLNAFVQGRVFGRGDGALVGATGFANCACQHEYPIYFGPGPRLMGMSDGEVKQALAAIK